VFDEVGAVLEVLAALSVGSCFTMPLTKGVISSSGGLVCCGAGGPMQRCKNQYGEKVVMSYCVVMEAEGGEQGHQ
jgi:hypothetical protein